MIQSPDASLNKTDFVTNIREKIYRYVPAIESLRHYSLSSLGLDTMAGLTVAAVAVPQAMAYAQIAGIPAQYGLYTAIVMTSIGALFDSSKQLINGPTNAISIAVLSAVVGLSEAIAMAKAIANKTRQKLDINQQCLSEGVANLVGSLFQCFPGSGSLTRSTINHQAGACTQWSGIISAIAVAGTMILFAPYAYFIPRAGLAGILMLSAWRLVDWHELFYHLKTTRFEAWIVLVTAISAVAISIEFCVLIGVFLSFVLYVPQAARVHLTELTLAQDRIVRERIATDTVCNRIRVYSLEGELFFGAAPELEEHLDKIAEEARVGVRVVVLRLKRARNADAVCLRVFDRFISRMQVENVDILLCGVRPDLMSVIDSSGLMKQLGRDRVFVFEETSGVWSSTLEAVRFAYEIVGQDVCESCPRRGSLIRGSLTDDRQDWYFMI